MPPDRRPRIIVTAHAAERAEERLSAEWIRDTGGVDLHQWLRQKATAALARFGIPPSSSEFALVGGGILFQMVNHDGEIYLKTVCRADDQFRKRRTRRGPGLRSSRRKPPSKDQELKEWEE